MKLSAIMGSGALLVGGGIVLAASAQVVSDLAEYGRTNFTIQFPYPDGPPLGAVFLFGIGAMLIGVITLLLPRAFPVLPLRD